MTGSNGRVTSEAIEGVIEATNDTGVRIAGAWLNRSKFHPVDLPEPGARVRLDVDAKGFIRSLDVLEPGPALASSTSRERTITRLAVLKAAAEFLGLMSQTREEVRSDHVLQIAEKWVAWVERA